MGLKELALASLLFFLPAKIDADYLGQINLNGKDVVVEKNDSDMKIITDSNENIREKRYRAFLDEKNEDMANEISGLNNSMLDLLGTPYSIGREGRGKMNAIFRKQVIPIQAFVYYNANPKLFVLDEGRKIGNIGSKELEKGENLLSGMDSNYYALYFSNWCDLINKIKATSRLIEDIKELTDIKFLFTCEEISDIKRDLVSWDIKNLEEMARVKLEVLKEAHKMGEKQIKVKNTEAYQDYLKKISNKRLKNNLEGAIGKYETKIVPIELLKDIISQISMLSETKLEKTRMINLEIKLERTRTNPGKCNYRLWTFSKEWKNAQKSIDQYYVLKFPDSLLIAHPKEVIIGNLVQKSYNVFSEWNDMKGKWLTDFAEDKNNRTIIEDKAKKYLMDETISHLIKGYIIKTKNIAEWLSWKITENYETQKVEKREELKKMFEKDYELTEIKICPSDGDITAKYFGFSMTDTNREIYVLERIRVENGFLQNRSFGNLESLILAGKSRSEIEYSNDLNVKNEKAINTKEIMESKPFENLELQVYFENRKRMYFQANTGAREFEVLKMIRIDKDDAEATVKTVNDFGNWGFLPIKTRYIETERIYLKRKDGKWTQSKTEKISSENYNVP
jgi:hypothetical protein